MKILLFLLVFLTSSTFGETTLPLEFKTGNPAPYGLPSTVITIQGKKIPLLFDTGARKDSIVLTEKVLQSLKVHFTGKQICATASDNKRHCLPEFIIPEVKLGDVVVLKNVRGSKMDKLWDDDKGFISTPASDNGLIGYALISQFNVLLNYPQGKVILYTKGEYPTEYNITQWLKIPFTDHLRTKMFINGKPLRFIWDTGAVPSRIKQDKIKEFSVEKCPQTMPYKCERIITRPTSEKGALFPETWFGISDNSAWPFDGLIGSNFYRENLVFFDFGKNSIYVKPS